MAAAWAAVVLGTSAVASPQEAWRFILPEQRRLEIRDPSTLPKARLPAVPPPRTVSDPHSAAEPVRLSLDDAIRTALANSEVVRVLAGTTATSSGRTVYDPAITNTQIDQARASFDPAIQVTNDFNRRETPQADPSGNAIVGTATQDYEMSMGLSKTTVTGATANLNVHTNPSRTTAGGLNPQTPSSVEMSLTQPLLQGGGSRSNVAPLLLARIDTERSFFQLKDSVQQLVRGVIEGYWALVLARTEAWVRRQQVQQGLEAYGFAKASLDVGRGNAADVAQSESALANFRANLITAEANVLQREAALRNLLGLPPGEPELILPVTPPSVERLDVDWTDLLRLAEAYRPDLIELKLIIEADQQRLLMARNQALPRIDATALYRWNGLEGRTPAGPYVSSAAGQFTGWQLGVNFSVPLGLRQSRAGLREQELIIMRDRANLHQGLHQAAHLLATNYRNLAQFYEQYEAFKVTRAAAWKNLDVQAARYRSGQEDALYLNVLEAITTWGNAVSSEAQALTQYNTELANLQQQTGTILEAHGIRFYEERYGSIGPLGRLFSDRCYPRDYRAGPNEARYERTSEPAENVFDLDVPLPARRSPAPGAGPSRSPEPPELPPLVQPSPGADRPRFESPEHIPLPMPQQ